MKKVLAVVLALVLIFSLIGCEKDSTTSSENSFMSSSADFSSSVEEGVAPIVDTLNEIYNSTKSLAFSHYNGGKVQDWFFKENDIQSVIEILKDLKITSVRQFNQEIDHKSILDFVLYFSETTEADHSTPSLICFGEQTVLKLNGLEYVVEVTNANDIVNRLTSVIDNLIYENFLKIDGEIKNSNEVLNDILKRTKLMEYKDSEGSDKTDTEEETLPILKIFSEIEITNLKPFSGDISTDVEQTVYYFYDTTEKDAPFFAQICLSSQRILFSDGTGYEFEYVNETNTYNLNRQIYHEFHRVILNRINITK